MRKKRPGFSSPRGARPTILPQINRAEVARRTGLDRCYVSRVFSGKTAPGVENLKKCAEACGVSLEKMDVMLQSARDERQRNTRTKRKNRPKRRTA